MSYKIAVLGVTGAVGREMLKCLEEYKIPCEVKGLASARSVGKKIPFNGSEIVVEEASMDAFEGMDYVLGAVEADMSKKFAPAIVKAGAVFIDNSSAFRMDDEVPLVVPEINGDDAFKNKGIISNPNCSTIITMMAVAPIAKISPIKTMVSCTYQAVSGAGQKGIDDLIQQEKSLMAGEKIVPTNFPAQIVRNAIPYIGSYKDNGYTSEEMKMQNEGRKILHLPELLVSCTCVRIPVMRSHSIATTVVCERKVSVEEAKAAINAFPGVHVVDDIDGRDYPTPLDTSDQNDVYVGRIRDDLTNPNGLCLWCCGDQIRKGAAANAVQILKLLVDKK